MRILQCLCFLLMFFLQLFVQGEVIDFDLSEISLELGPSNASDSFHAVYQINYMIEIRNGVDSAAIDMPLQVVLFPDGKGGVATNAAIVNQLDKTQTFVELKNSLGQTDTYFIKIDIPFGFNATRELFLGSYLLEGYVNIRVSLSEKYIDQFSLIKILRYLYSSQGFPTDLKQTRSGQSIRYPNEFPVKNFISSFSPTYNFPPCINRIVFDFDIETLPVIALEHNRLMVIDTESRRGFFSTLINDICSVFDGNKNTSIEIDNTPLTFIDTRSLNLRSSGGNVEFFAFEKKWNINFYTKKEGVMVIYPVTFQLCRYEDGTFELANNRDRMERNQKRYISPDACYNLRYDNGLHELRINHINNDFRLELIDKDDTSETFLFMCSTIINIDDFRKLNGSRLIHKSNFTKEQQIGLLSFPIIQKIKIPRQKMSNK